MKNKILSILAISFVLCTCLFALTACGDNEPQHTHNYSTLKFDEENHWFECECEEKNNVVAHNIINGGCVCGYIVSHSHKYTTLKTDETEHWYECTCGDKSNIENHNYNTLKYSKTQHWNECVCGDKDRIENHTGGTATCTELAKCSVCHTEYGGYAPHTYESKWSYNETYHWREYTCDCDVKANFEQHTPDDSGWCSICEQAVLPTNGIYYEVSADGTYAEVVAYLGTSKKANIASTHKGVPVTRIYSNAFKKTAITTVIIPDSVTSIGASAFDGCYNLKSITIPDSVTRIGDRAFDGCYSLMRVDISNIEAWCNISFGSSSANPLYYAKKLYLNNTLVKELVIPDNVTSVGDNAFKHCSSLTSVVIGNGVSSIGYDAFAYCSSLTSVVLGDSVTTIRSCAFFDCSSLTSITIPEGDIGSKAFYNCSSLMSVIIGDGVTSISASAFSGCDRLRSIAIPDSVTSIGSSAFEYCSSLTSVVIGDGVTSIGSSAFYYCPSLTSITFRDTTTWYRTANSFDWCNKVGGTQTDVTSSSANVTYFRSTYCNYGWYKL